MPAPVRFGFLTVSFGGIGFDISCGMRMPYTGLTLNQLLPRFKVVADRLAVTIPAGLSSTGTH